MTLKYITLGLILFQTMAFAAKVRPLHNAEQVPYKSIRIEYSASQGLVVNKAVEVFKRVLKEKSGKDFFQPSKKQLTISLNIKRNAVPSESYQIQRLNANTIAITAGDENGILYGLGKILHSSYFNTSDFIASSYEGTATPDKTFRGIYFATHFHNFYHAAPIAEVTRYIEELALWGYNGLYVWFDMHHYTGINDPDALDMQKRLAQFLKAGRSVGMKSGVVMLANEGYKTSPEALRAIPNTFTDHYKVEICPNLPGGSALILKQVEEELDAFLKLGVTIDAIGLWPYDQGGCDCGQCRPWGGNGYLKITESISGLIRKKLPQAQLILSTWLFDFKEEDKGEWRGLASAFQERKPWVDYIMADSHTSYPKYVLNHPVPGKLPLLNFPEISMWGNWPWGGYGANPMPARFQKLWDGIKNKVVGGYPYSEGIFEDLNKVLYSQFYWTENKPAKEILHEYVSFEFSKDHAADIVQCIEIMEANYGLSAWKWASDPKAPQAIRINSKDQGAAKVYEMLSGIDAKLPITTRKTWRWRLLLLRALLDNELRKTNGTFNPKINEAFQEISDIQFLNHAHPYVKPPVNSGEGYPIKKFH